MHQVLCEIISNMFKCFNIKLNNICCGEYYTAGIWYCSDACKRTYSKKKSSSKETLKEDGTFNYISSLTYMGLMDLVRQNAVRENDGDAMMSHWRLDLLHFHNYHHPKYVLLGHRLLAGNYFYNVVLMISYSFPFA